MTEQNSKIVDISPIKINDSISLNEDRANWASVIKSFNVFGIAGEAYAKTLAYKVETKRLEAEVIRVREQTKIAESAMEKMFALKMQELQNRQKELSAIYLTIHKELGQIHVERKTIMKMAETSHQKALDSNTSDNLKKMYFDVSIEMLKQIPLLGDRANIQINQLIQALPPIQTPINFLEGS